MSNGFQNSFFSFTNAVLKGSFFLKSNNSKKIEVKAPDLLDNNIALTLPRTVGAAGQVLTTDGSGIMSWATVSGSGSGSGVVTDASIVFSDVTTNDFSILKHGFVPKSPGGTSAFLRADGTWATPPSGSGSGATALTSLTDVTVTAPTSGQVLKYDGTRWVNATVSGGGTTYTAAAPLSISGSTISIAASTALAAGTMSPAQFAKLESIPAFVSGGTRFLKEDGTWASVSSGGSSSATYITTLPMRLTALNSGETAIEIDASSATSSGSMSAAHYTRLQKLSVVDNAAANSGKVLAAKADGTFELVTVSTGSGISSIVSNNAGVTVQVSSGAATLGLSSQLSSFNSLSLVANKYIGTDGNGALALLAAPSGSGTVYTGTTPITVTGSAISISAASASTPGYMSSSDFSKLSSIPAFTANGTKFLKEDGTWAAISGSGSGITSVSGTAPVTATTTNGAVTVSMSAASAVQDGYMTAGTFGQVKSLTDLVTVANANKIIGINSSGTALVATTASSSGISSVTGSTGLTATTTSGAVALSLSSNLTALSGLTLAANKYFGTNSSGVIALLDAPSGSGGTTYTGTAPITVSGSTVGINAASDTGAGSMSSTHYSRVEKLAPVDTLTGNGGKVLAVKSDASGLEFVTQSSGSGGSSSSIVSRTVQLTANGKTSDFTIIGQGSSSDAALISVSVTTNGDTITVSNVPSGFKLTSFMYHQAAGFNIIGNITIQYPEIFGATSLGTTVFPICLHFTAAGGAQATTSWTISNAAGIVTAVKGGTGANAEFYIKMNLI